MNLLHEKASGIAYHSETVPEDVSMSDIAIYREPPESQSVIVCKAMIIRMPPAVSVAAAMKNVAK